MKGKETLFFTELEDIGVILKELEQINRVHYYKTGLFDDSITPHYTSIFESGNVGFVSNGDWNHNDSFLILPLDTEINLRNISQKNGGIKFAVDQLTNKKSVFISIGGIYKEGTIVAGKINTISEDEFSLQFYKIASSLIRKKFKKVGSFYVGEKAYEKLKLGWRLVTNEKSPKEYDLILA